MENRFFKTLCFLILIIVKQKALSQISEIYIMSSPSLRNSKTENSNNSAKNEGSSKINSKVIPINVAIDFLVSKKLIFRTNYYYQNRSLNINSYQKDNLKTNDYRTYERTFKDNKIYSIYIDLLRKKEHDLIHFYYGIWIGGYYQLAFKDISTRIIFVNNLQTEKQIAINTIAPIRALQTGFVICAYFKIVKNVFAGFEIRNSINYSITRGIEEQMQTIYGPTNNYIDSKKSQNKTNTKEISLDFFNPFISIKYTLPYFKSNLKAKPTNQNE